MESIRMACPSRREVPPTLRSSSNIPVETISILLCIQCSLLTGKGIGTTWNICRSVHVFPVALRSGSSSDNFVMVEGYGRSIDDYRPMKIEEVKFFDESGKNFTKEISVSSWLEIGIEAPVWE